MLRKILPAALDADIFAVSSTRPSAGFLSKCTLLNQTEHDGDNGNVVAIVDRTANVPRAASAVGFSRASFNGKSCYAPDVVLVNEFVADDFIFHLVHAVTSPVSKVNPSMAPRLPNVRADSHAPIMQELQSNDGCKVVMSGANGSIVEISDR